MWVAEASRVVTGTDCLKLRKGSSLLSPWKEAWLVLEGTVQYQRASKGFHVHIYYIYIIYILYICVGPVAQSG